MVETKLTRYMPVALTRKLSGNYAALDALRSEHFPLSLWSRLVSCAHTSALSEALPAGFPEQKVRFFLHTAQLYAAVYMLCQPDSRLDSVSV